MKLKRRRIGGLLNVIEKEMNRWVVKNIRQQ